MNKEKKMPQGAVGKIRKGETISPKKMADGKMDKPTTTPPAGIKQKGTNMQKKGMKG